MKLRRFFALNLAATVLLSTLAFVSPTEVYAETYNDPQYTEGFYTYIITNATAHIIDCDPAITGDVIIPSSLGGYRVGSIGSSAFSNCSGLTSVVIPDSITSIGTSAFSGCTNLKYNTYDNAKYLGSYNNAYYALIKGPSENITDCKIHDATRLIASSAFYHCTKITSLTIPSVAYVNDTFFNCKIKKLIIADGTRTITDNIIVCKSTLEEVIIPASVVKIDTWAFSSCSKLTHITIPNSVINIENYAFRYCSSLTSIIISDSTTSIGNYAFDGCNIKKIIVAAGSKSVTSTIIVCEDTLEEVIIPNSVARVENYAFGSCSKLTTITLTSNISSVGEKAFLYCSSLANIYYSGTKRQAEEIEIGNNNDYFKNATWHYNEIYAQEDLQEALTMAAEGGTTVILTQDVTLSSVVVRSGVTLDLNGYALTTSYFTCYGNVIDGAAGGNGLVKAIKGIHIAGKESYLPIYDIAADSYRLYKYSLQNLEYKTVADNSNVVKVGISLSLDNAAGYDVLATTTDESLNLFAHIGLDDRDSQIIYQFKNATLRSYVSQVYADIVENGSSSLAIILTISGIDSLEENTSISVQPVFETAPGLTVQGNSSTWTVT